MIGTPIDRFCIDPAEIKLGEIELINEGVDRAKGIVFANPIVRHSGNDMPARDPCPQQSTSSDSPLRSHGNPIGQLVSTQPESVENADLHEKWLAERSCRIDCSVQLKDDPRCRLALAEAG